MNNFNQYFSHPPRRLAQCLVVAVSMIIVSFASAQSNPGDRAVIEIVQIEHRDPATIKLALLPLLDSRGSIGQLDDKLVIATTASNLLDLKSVIGARDIAPRRLVVSVDFLHLPDSGSDNNTYQYITQAVEGEQVSFVAQPAEDSEVLPSGLQSATISVLAELRGEIADVDLNVANLSGFADQQQLQVSLGQWYALHPAVAQADPDLQQGNAPEPAPVSAPIAVRVDALP